jgi:hypothetical protein
VAADHEVLTDHLAALAAAQARVEELYGRWADRDDEGLRPVPTSHRDPAAIRPTPVDAYVLSRIDGVTSVARLALISGEEGPFVKLLDA